MATDPKLPDDVNEIEEGDVPVTKSTAPLAKRVSPRSAGNYPNKPNFDHSGGKSPKPRLRKGEKVLVEKETNGVRYVVTSEGRWIYLCSLDEYQTRVNVLPGGRALYARFFTQAE